MYKENNLFLFDADTTFANICDILSKESNSIVLNFVAKRNKTRYSDIQRELKRKGIDSSVISYALNRVLKEGLLCKVKNTEDRNNQLWNYTLTFKGRKALEIEKNLYTHLEKEKS